MDLVEFAAWAHYRWSTEEWTSYLFQALALARGVLRLDSFDGRQNSDTLFCSTGSFSLRRLPRQLFRWLTKDWASYSFLHGSLLLAASAAPSLWMVDKLMDKDTWTKICRTTEYSVGVYRSKRSYPNRMKTKKISIR